jgi:hypothetical protein
MIFLIEEKWYSLNEESAGNSNYGAITMDDKNSLYSNITETLESNKENASCLRLPNSLTWPSAFFKRHNSVKKQGSVESGQTSNTEQQLRSKVTHKRTDNFYMERLSASKTSISSSSLSGIVSQENLNRISAEASRSNTIVNYSIYLNESNKSLVLNLISLENVRLPDALKPNQVQLNIYVKIELQIGRQDSKMEARTRLIKNKTNPIYDETFEFEHLDLMFNEQEKSAADMMMDDERCLKLVIKVCNSNQFGRDQLIGQVEHQLSREELSKSNRCQDQLFSRSAQQASEASISCRISNICRIYSKKIDTNDSSKVSIY